MDRSIDVRDDPGRPDAGGDPDLADRHRRRAVERAGQGAPAYAGARRTADVIVDFTKFKPGTRFILSNSAPTPFPAGAKVLAGLTDRIMAFDVVAATGVDTSLAPKDLVNLNRTDPVPAPAVVAPTRDIALYETLDEFGRVTPLLGTP